MDKVESIAAGCHVTEYFVSLLVFEDQVFVKLLFFYLTRFGLHVSNRYNKVLSLM